MEAARESHVRLYCAVGRTARNSPACQSQARSKEGFEANYDFETLSQRSMVLFEARPQKAKDIGKVPGKLRRGIVEAGRRNIGVGR